mmetsp:Transcript_3932/g.5303  ORF Transcript_3932/g.5303 Transcript_3932/m.5303 type:complete len:263 (-) Transcript_3932:647-1435(-)
MGCSSSRSTGAVLIQENNNNSSRRKSIAPELSKNRAVIDSAKALAVLAQSLGPENENVKDALEGIVDPANGSPLHYWSCKGCTTHNGASRNQCVSCNEAKDPSDEMKLAIEDESTAESNDDSSDPLDEALASVECPICFETYQDPVVLPCGHSFCTEHTLSLDDKCPFCREEFADRPAENAHLAMNAKAILSLGEIIDPDRLTIRDAIKPLPDQTTSEEGNKELMRQEQIRLDEQLARELQGREYDHTDNVIQLAAEALFNM